MVDVCQVFSLLCGRTHTRTQVHIEQPYVALRFNVAALCSVEQIKDKNGLCGANCIESEYDLSPKILYSF